MDSLLAKKIRKREKHRPQPHGIFAIPRGEHETWKGGAQTLLRVVGSSAALIASLNSRHLPVGAVESADLLATSINSLSEETLQDALNAVRAEIEEEQAAGGN